MIQLRNLSKSYGGNLLFSQATLQIGDGERCAIVGRNGSGKSTLLRMLAGLETPDEGDIQLPKNLRIGTLPQHITFTEATVLEEALLALPKEQRQEKYRVEKILTGLGFPLTNLSKSPQSLSGGYRLRLALCKVLAAEPELLLLDEPTNYLDILSIRWLERFLSRWKGEILFISHDRAFVNKVCTHTIGINRKQLRKVEGGVEKYYSLIEQQEETYEKSREKLEKKKAHMQAFIDRFGAKATKAGQAQSRQKALDKLGSMDELATETTIDFSFRYKNFSGKQLLNAKNVSFYYKPDQDGLVTSKDGLATPTPLIQNVSLTVEPHERIAIIGKNGRGKSTFLQLLTGELKPTSGEVILSPNATIAYFGQASIDKLDLSATIEEEVKKTAPSTITYQELRTACGIMLFGNEEINKKIGVLSGGERSRVVLAKILLTPANLLILDEPTHHLDIESIAVLMRALETFQGTVLLVSHEEGVLNDFHANRMVIFQQNRQELFLGSYEEFLERKGWEEEEVEKATTKPVDSSYLIQKQQRNDAAKNKRLIEKLEKEIQELEIKRETLAEEMAHHFETKGGLAPQTSLYEATSTKLDALYDQLHELS